MKAIKESKMLLEVWRAKERAAKEVEHLDLRSAIRKRLEDSIRASKEQRQHKDSPVNSRH
jgi:hypothetical protein